MSAAASVTTNATFVLTGVPGGAVGMEVPVAVGVEVTLAAGVGDAAELPLQAANSRDARARKATTICLPIYALFFMEG
jgi:hypothetical protein